MMGLRIAKVVRFVPEAHAADLLFLDDGSRVPMVQVLAGSASTNTGVADMAQPGTPPSGDMWGPQDSGTRDILAVVGYVRRAPVVLGFLYPQVAQMLFADRNRKVERHASDVYTTIDDDGNVEVYHPSGTYFRIGTDPAHEDLTGKDFDGKWKIERNTDKAVHVHLSVKNAGAEVASLNMDPAGNVDLANQGNLNATVGGEANVTATAQIRFSVGMSTITMNPSAITLSSNGSTIVLDAAGVAANGARIDLN